MTKYHSVEHISFTNDNMKLKVDGKEYSFPLPDVSERLAKASKIERETYEISPSGYGIHWPLIDEDLSVDGLIGSTHQPKSESLKTTA